MSAVKQATLQSLTIATDDTFVSEQVCVPASATEFIFQAAVTRTAGTFNGKIQHSVDGTNWHDLVAFTAASATGVELKFPTTSVGQYLRSSITSSGTANLVVEIIAAYRVQRT